MSNELHPYQISMNPTASITNISTEDYIHTLAEAARVSHQSKGDNDETLVRKILGWGHYSVLEHINVTVKLECDIKLAMAIMRHRFLSITQESTRYCNYANREKFPNGVKVFMPDEIMETSENMAKGDDYIQKLPFTEFTEAIASAIEHYDNLIACGISPEAARAVLPMCTKTQTVITTNLREWRHLIALRIMKENHKDMQVLARILLNRFYEKFPIIFESIRATQINLDRGSYDKVEGQS